METNKRIKKPYENFEVYHPEGHLMFRCAKKRVDWYLKRDLAKKINEKSIILTFTPNGYGEDSESLNIKRENICVCCGDKNIENLTKHHIVPYNFRKYMPEEYKSRSSIDLVTICRECHYKYEKEAMSFKKFLYKNYGVELKQPKEPKENYLFKKIKRKEHAIDKVSRLDIKEKLRNDIYSLKKEFNQTSKVSFENFEIQDVKTDDPAEILVKKLNDHKFLCYLWVNHFFANTNPQYMDIAHQKYLKKKYS